MREKGGRRVTVNKKITIGGICVCVLEEGARLSAPLYCIFNF
jgi:hypothetical protein